MSLDCAHFHTKTNEAGRPGTSGASRGNHRTAAARRRRLGGFRPPGRWQHGVFAHNNGLEVPLLYGVAALTLALTGHGAFSLDAALDLTWPQPVIWGVLGVGILGGFGNLAIRKAVPAPAHV